MSWSNNMSYGQPVLLVQAPMQDPQQVMRIPKNGDGMSLRKIKKTIAFLKELEEAKKGGGKDKKDEDKKKDEAKLNPVQAFAALIFLGPPVGLMYLWAMFSMGHYVIENLHTMVK